METFPSLYYGFPLPLEEEFKTRISDFESGQEQRQRCWAFPRRTVNLESRNNPQTEINALWKFYRERYGAYEAFWFVMPTNDDYYNEYVGRGDGLTKTFDLPSIGTAPASLTVYVDGGDTEVLFVSGGGQASSDRITFSAAPDEGALITADFYGRLRLYARFGQDKLTRELFSVLLYNASLEIREIKQET